MTAPTPHAGGRGGPHVCPRCGAERLHRSHPRTLVESLGRSVLRLRIYRCHACELRLRTFSHPGRSGAEHGGPGRALERRDRIAQWRRRRTIVLTVLVAAAIGAAVAKWFVLD